MEALCNIQGMLFQQIELELPIFLGVMKHLDTDEYAFKNFYVKQSIETVMTTWVMNFDGI